MLLVVAVGAFAAGAGMESVKTFSQVLRAPGFEVWDDQAKAVEFEVGDAIRSLQQQVASLQMAAPATASGSSLASEMREWVQKYNAAGRQINDLNQTSPSDPLRKPAGEVAVALSKLRSDQREAKDHIRKMSPQMPPSVTAVVDLLDRGKQWPTVIQIAVSDPLAAEIFNP